MHWSLQLKGGLQIESLLCAVPASLRFQIQNVIYVNASLHSLLQLHLSHSHCTLLSTNLWPYWTQLKVQRAICHAIHCSRQNVQRHFRNSGHINWVGEHMWIKNKLYLSFLAKLRLMPNLLLTSQQRFWSSFVTRATGPRRGCLVLMNGVRASVLTLPSISFRGCTELKTDNSCWTASAGL